MNREVFGTLLINMEVISFKLCIISSSRICEIEVKKMSAIFDFVNLCHINVFNLHYYLLYCDCVFLDIKRMHVESILTDIFENNISRKIDYRI